MVGLPLSISRFVLCFSLYLIMFFSIGQLLVTTEALCLDSKHCGGASIQCLHFLPFFFHICIPCKQVMKVTLLCSTCPLLYSCNLCTVYITQQLASNSLGHLLFHYSLCIRADVVLLWELVYPF